MTTSITPALHSWPDISSEFSNSGLLLGNGFSQAVWRKFGYSSIYDAACSSSYVDHSLTDEDQQLFRSMQTTNFESVLSSLAKTSDISQIFRFTRESQYLQERYEYIKTSLGEAIKEVHIPWGRMPDSVVSFIRQELRRFQCIYSTNYDLLICWAIMSQNRGDGFKDLFWARDPGASRDQDTYFDLADSTIRYEPYKVPPTRVFYLHGALHLYRDPFTGKTYKFKNKGHSNLLEISEIPLFITEGSPEVKLKAIRGSDYLSFAYSQLLNHHGPLVIFGHSLSDSDAHLINAIRNAIRSGEVQKIAISLRSSHSPEELLQRKANLRYSLCNQIYANDQPEVFFFDAQTHPLGSKHVRVEEKQPCALTF
ncbi:hypothetical protein Lepto7375DRAFT_0969 [Leptolyngbya sp. PCC 7375]|nr:hypothetical protein Lepto7375DRAFT_0969 [Leptolyngbya sp. PCC 7375]